MRAAGTPNRGTTMQRSIRIRTRAVLAAAVLVLAGCGGEDPAADAGAAATDAGDAAEEVADDLEDVAEDAQDTLDEAGIDPDAGGVAEVEFRGETYTIDAAERFGCFIIEDGGSQGAVDFDGSDAAGNAVTIGWAGDSLDSSFLEFVAADGTEYQLPIGREVDVTIEGSAATVRGTVMNLTDFTEHDLAVSASCN